jgi:hypothetical protein
LGEDKGVLCEWIVQNRSVNRRGEADSTQLNGHVALRWPKPNRNRLAGTPSSPLPSGPRTRKTENERKAGATPIIEKNIKNQRQKRAVLNVGEAEATKAKQKKIQL